MTDWLFTDPEGKQTVLDLPHTWNGRDGQDGGNDYRRCTCTYAKTVKKPVFDPETECVYLQFQGVNASAVVILNGREILKHEGGYSTFRTEVTALLQEENELVVKADNSKNNRVYPQMADFTFYGGIYRDVEFLIVPREHFDLDYCGGEGLKITPRLAEDSGEVLAEAFVRGVEDVEVEITLLDAEGIAVAGQSISAGQRLNPETLWEKAAAVCGAVDCYRTSLQVEAPHLWQGVKDPYLYQAVAELKRGDQVLDRISTWFGIRSFSFDPEKGFFLNGKSYPLYGVSRHQDRKDIGNAISRELMEEDMELIKEVGANTIRLAHYQHNQYFYDLCDRAGMVVWAEIPYISAHMPEGRANTFYQMEELIVQNYNHPCIVTWGISNEITISRKHKKDMLDNHHALQKFTGEMDPTRPTTLACYAMCTPFHPVTKITDIVAWNLYLGWYVPGLFLNDLFMKFYHLLYPGRCLGYSEYGAEGMPNLHSEHPRRGDNTEEYQNIYHEYMLECFKRHPFLWGTYVWNMFDFAADARNQGGEPGMNHKGLVTFDRKLKKDSFYLYKAYWNQEDAFVYIAGRRFVYRKKANNVITVYSNQEKVSLYQNGSLVGTLEGGHVFKFKVNLKDGKNVFEVRSGGLSDRAEIYRTDEAHPEYKVQKADTRNWM